MKIEYVDINSIKPYELNAKKHPEEQVEHIANSIRDFGWKQPIVVDKEGTVVIGHGRLLAAKLLQMDKVPVVRADDLTEEQAKALRLADNKTNESPWDFELMEAEIDGLDVDMSNYGFVIDKFDEAELDGFFGEAEPKEKEPKKIRCPHCGELFEI